MEIEFKVETRYTNVVTENEIAAINWPETGIQLHDMKI